MLKNKLVSWGATLLILALTAFGAPAAAEWPEKPIRLIVPYSPGGGFDTFARAFAPQLESILGAEIIVDNVSGAGGRRGVQKMLNADPDGYTLAMFNIPGMVIAQVTDDWKNIDLTEVVWIANLSKANYSLALSAKGDVLSVEGLCTLNRPAKLGATGVGSSSYSIAVILMESLGCPYTIVTGYKGSTESVLAVVRGEVDAMLTGIDSLRKFVDSGDIIIGLTFSTDTVVDGVPTTTEINQPQLSSVAQLRMVGAPPGTPADVIAKLESAFEQVASSQTTLAWSKSTNRAVTYMDAEATSRTIREQIEVMQSFAPAFK